MAKRKRKQRSKPKFRSKFEATVDAAARELGHDLAYEPKSSVLVWTPKPRKYQPDFELPNGVLVETKGRFTAADRSKMLQVRDQHPEKDIRLVFMYDNTLSRASSTRYSEWAEKHGFLWAIRKIPSEWFE